MNAQTRSSNVLAPEGRLVQGSANASAIDLGPHGRKHIGHARNLRELYLRAAGRLPPFMSATRIWLSASEMCTTVTCSAACRGFEGSDRI